VTHEDISRLIAYTRILWPGQRDVELRDQIIGWSRHLDDDVPAEAAEAAVDDWANAGNRFPPPVGWVRRRALLLVNQTGAPSADEAWEEVQRKISTVGYFSTVQDLCERRDCPGPTCDHHEISFTHPAIDAVVDSIGWRTLCLSTDLMVDRAHFLKMYGVAVERIERERTMPPSVAQLERGPVPEIEGPPSETVRPLPSGSVTEPRDDVDGIARVQQVKRDLAKTRRLD
jgi:hypothetical protein